MSIQKTKYIWIVNLILFVAVVFLGIEQAGRGAEISSLEDRLESNLVEKRELTENIFRTGNNTNVEQKVTDLGFAKPSKTYYFNSIDTVASR
jgi:hypothetical protein